MKSNIIKVFWITAGAVFFNLLFWKEIMGINTLLYDLLLLGGLFFFYPGAWKRITVRGLMAAHLLCLAMLILHNTILSKFAVTATLLLLSGFVNFEHRSAWYAGGSVMLNMLFMPASYVELLPGLQKAGLKWKRLARLFRYAFFPLLFLLVFAGIYSLANSVFGDLTGRFASLLQGWIEQVLASLSVVRFLFLLLGLFLTGSLLLPNRVSYFSRIEKGRPDVLLRRRRPRLSLLAGLLQSVMERFARGMTALKDENKIGVLSLALLNALILVVNIIDIRYLWFGFDYQNEPSLYKLLHQGTGLLIFSIILAMCLLLFFFKGNLNFYRGNKWLKYGAYAWIVQNGILVVSVFLRDYYYVAKYGLAYKRLGVFFFLLMVLIGLVSVFQKIRFRKTNYYLLRVNAWAGIIVLVLASTVDWDNLMAGYNFAHRETIPLDVPFLLSLSDRTLPLLDRNSAYLQSLETAESGSSAKGPGSAPCPGCYLERLKTRENEYIRRQEVLSWLSWNWADWKTRQYLVKRKKDSH